MGPWGPVIGAALGAQRAKNEQVENNRQNRTEIAREMWSPWTGRHGKDQASADYMGKIMQGAMTGMMMAQQMGAAEGAAGAAGAGAADQPGNMYATSPVNGVNQAPTSPIQSNQFQNMRSGNGNMYVG